MVRTAVEESLKEKTAFDEKYRFQSFSELLDCLNSSGKSLKPADWHIIHMEKSVLFLKIEENPMPRITLSVVIGEDLLVTINKENSQIKKLGCHTFPRKVNYIQEIFEILEELASSLSTGRDEKENFIQLDLVVDLIESLKGPLSIHKSVLDFISEQLCLLKTNHKSQHRYSGEFLVLCCLLYSVSPHGYKFLRSSNSLILPHPCTLMKLCSSHHVNPKDEQVDEHFLAYAKEKFPHIEEWDKTVALMVDEIHIKQFIDFKGGSLCGIAYDADAAAKSAHVFMLQSVRSPYKDVVHIFPVASINAEVLFNMIQCVTKKLEEIGFTVVVISTDNNAVNRKAMSYFATPPVLSIVYPHPTNQSRPLFYIIDPVHIFKCIRNNWLNQKNPHKCMFFPPFAAENEKTFLTSSLLALKKLHQQERLELVKYAPSLTEKALSPNNLERQSVQLA